MTREVVVGNRTSYMLLTQVSCAMELALVGKERVRCCERHSTLGGSCASRCCVVQPCGV